MNTTCPYCDSRLDKIPQRKTICPDCGNPIYVKKPFGQGEKVLMTEQQVAQEEERWRTEQDKKRWFALLQPLGISDSDLKD